MSEGWKCRQCGYENKLDKETVDRAFGMAAKGLAFAPVALLFGSIKALGWLFIGIAALKWTGVI
jgi:FtsH-binding integral membrane protein